MNRSHTHIDVLKVDAVTMLKSANKEMKTFTLCLYSIMKCFYKTMITPQSQQSRKDRGRFSQRAHRKRTLRSGGVRQWNHSQLKS